MAKIIYMITYDFNIYTKPDIWDKEYKIYDYQTGFFKELETKPKYIDENILIADLDVIKDIMKNIVYSEYGKILDEDKMKWYLNFEKESKKYTDLLNNEELLYNYLILKSMLAGATEEEAKIIFSDYFNKKRNNIPNLISYNKIIEKLDFFIKNKKYWIPDITNEEKKEILLLDDMMRSRAENQNYKYELFEKRYLDICNSGYIRKIMEYNKNPNNDFSKGIPFLEQKDFLIKFFNKRTEECIDALVEYYPYFKGNFASKKMIIDNMQRTLEYAMKFWE